MSPPCTSFFSPDSAAAVTTAALPGPSGAAAAARADEPGSPSFDNLLSQAGQPAASAPAEIADVPADTGLTEKEPADPAAPSSTPTPEQIVLLAGLALPGQAAPVPPPPAAPKSAETADSGLAPLGAAGRSVPQLLAQGVPVLEYQLPAARAAAAAAPSAGAPSAPAASSPASAAAAPGAAPTAAQVPPAAAATLSETAAAPARERAVSAAYGAKDAGVLAAAGQKLPVSPATRQPAAAVAPTTASEAAAPSVVDTPAAAAAPAPGAPATPTAESPLPAAAAAPSPGVSAADAGRPVQRTGAKLAETSPSGTPSGVNSPEPRGKNKTLVAEDQELASVSPRVGTTAAKWGKSMYEDSRKTAASPAADVSAGALGISRAVTPEFSATPAASAPHAAAASHAGQLVHEIREIADGLWAVDRNSVEVKFNFGESERLSVRVEYRDGSVQATFRTDSPELRDVIAREWNSQSADRPYRVADPVFSSSSGFSLGGGDTSRQQRDADAPPPFERFAGLGGRSTPSNSTSAASAPSSRPDSAGYLHALV